MSTFAELCALPNPGFAILVDVSTDRFVSTLSVSGVEQKWSTVAGFFNNPSANFYGGGIASVGRLQRSLGTDGMPAAGTCSLVLDNTDGAFDWLTARGTVATMLKARFRVYVAAFDPANPGDNQVQLAGTYTPLDNPQRDESRVFLELADDVLSDAADLALTPSLKTWLDHASTTSGNTPWAASSGTLGPGVEWATDQLATLPLAFGRVKVPLLRIVRGPLELHPFAICCTTDVAVPETTPDAWIEGIESANFGPVPRGSGLFQLFYLRRSPFNISRDGKSWRIWLAEFNVTSMLASAWVMNDVLGGEFGAPSSSSAVSVDKKAFTDAFFSKLGQLWCTAFPLSAHTYSPVSAVGGSNSLPTANVLCVDAARDLLQQYCRGSIIVDVPSFDAVAAHAPNARVAAHVGSIGQRVSKPLEQTGVIAEAGQVRGILQGLCQAGSFDFTTLQAGQVRALANTATYEAYVGAAALSAQRLDETRMVADSLRVRTPSQGQRWAPYNRVFLEVGSAGGNLSPGRNGPYDHDANLTAWGRPFTRILNAEYADVSQTLGNAFSIINDEGFPRVSEHFPVESIVRPVISFRYGLEALELDLGDYFILSLTRGGNTGFLDTYVDVMWKTEALNLIPDTGQVEVTAVWAGDVLSDVPFLLDDETAITRTSSATLGSGNTASDDTFKLVSGSFVTAGVAVGDILVLQDSAEAEEAFDRNRGVRITVVTAIELTLAESITSTATVATWKILRGATTYPVAGDPGYPDGGRMFGKAADDSADGEFSDSTLANKMLGG